MNHHQKSQDVLMISSHTADLAISTCTSARAQISDCRIAASKFWVNRSSNSQMHRIKLKRKQHNKQQISIANADKFNYFS